MIPFVTRLTDQHFRIVPRFPKGHRTHCWIPPSLIFYPNFAYGYILALTLLPAGLAHFAFRTLPTSTLAGSQSSVQTGSMIVMPTAGTEEQVTQLPWPLTHCTASLLCSRKEAKCRSVMECSRYSRQSHRANRYTILGTADTRVSTERQIQAEPLYSQSLQLFYWDRKTVVLDRKMLCGKIKRHSWPPLLFSPKCAAPSLCSGQSSCSVLMDKKEPLAVAQGKW